MPQLSLYQKKCYLCNMSNTTSNRVEALDAFRGIASFLIMVTHIILFVPQVCQGENLGYIYGGLSWKLPYFFVLSGFVLTLSYQRSKERLHHPFRTFLVSRVLRVYPLFIITTLVMFLLKVIFGAGEPVEGASIFFNISWRLAPSLTNLLHALTLIGLENTWLYNGPAWTLVFEMRFALLFPLLVALLRRSWVAILLFVGAALGATYISSGLERTDLFYSPNQLVSNMCSMFSFLLLYTGGVLLALNRDRLMETYQSLSTWGSRGVLVGIIVAVLNPLWIRYVIPASLPHQIGSVIGDCVMLLGVMTWIIVLLGNQSIAKCLSNRVLMVLGRSSFSIYMWHTPIATAVYMLLHEHINIWYTVAISIVATLMIAPLSFRYIEQPIIALSYRLRR